MIWDFISTIYNFIIKLFTACESIWNWEFTIGAETFQFNDLITGALIIIIGLALVKKLVPLA